MAYTCVKELNMKDWMTEKPAGDRIEYLSDLWKNCSSSFEAVEQIMKEKTDRFEYIKDGKLLYNEETC